MRQQFARIELTAWPTALVWAPSRLLLACATVDSRVVVHLASLHFLLEFFQLSAAALAPVADLRAHQEGVWSLAWSYPSLVLHSPPRDSYLRRRSPDGKWLVSGVCVDTCLCLLCTNFSLGSADNKIVIWDTSAWIVHQVLATPAAHVLSLAWWHVSGEVVEGASNIDKGNGGSHLLVAGTWEGHLLMWVGMNSSAVQGDL